MAAKNSGAGVDRKALVLLCAAVLLCLVPYLGKAFNSDEPLFIWAARHIQSDPLNFYNFTVNWYGTASSAARVIKNPPLASYYLALAGSHGGWGEAWLHLAFLVPALVAAVGSYGLMKQFSAQGQGDRHRLQTEPVPPRDKQNPPCPPFAKGGTLGPQHREELQTSVFS